MLPTSSCTNREILRVVSRAAPRDVGDGEQCSHVAGPLLDAATRSTRRGRRNHKDATILLHAIDKLDAIGVRVGTTRSFAQADAQLERDEPLGEVSPPR